MKSRRFFVAVMVAGACFTVGAQSDDLRFEVASVKPNNAGDGPIEMGTQPGGRLTMINVPLRLLIRNAYQVQDFQIVDAPKWIGDERFDILAKAPGDVAAPTPGNSGSFQPMVRSLLAERFRLVVHRETRELPVYALQRVRTDGRLGPQIHASTADCAAIAASRQGPPSADSRPQCGIRASGGHMLAGGLPLSQLATLLSTMVERVVVDRTGLAGTFDFELNWTPDRALQQSTPNGVPVASSDDPPIVTALREQLGLKLEPAKAPADVLVIDHVERPAPN
jgi:bla regulator protein blaR1